MGKDIKDINPKDINGKAHGYNEWYWSNDTLWLRCVMKHGEPLGYEELHLTHNQSETTFYIR